MLDVGSETASSSISHFAGLPNLSSKLAIDP
jgi:hypothetical protein